MEEQTIDLDTISRQLSQLAQFPSLGIDIQEHHAHIVISYGPGNYLVQAVTAEQMNDICHKWLTRHKERHETH